ncbi:MAG: RsmD family RNA methyltransferase [Flavobacteriaceae bacterium]
MNLSILHKEVQDYIQQNLTSDITKLILKGSPFPNISVQELANQIIAKQKSKTKLPTWFQAEGIYYPNKLSIEQTSSEITAQYKSTLVSGNSIIDLTGGFGVDTFYFAKKFKSVIHCELNAELSEIVSHNNQQLQIGNITTIAENSFKYLKDTSTHFDVIYIDPSRRNDQKEKVFLLKDCEPNIPENLKSLFDKSNHILIKNSPILDITSTIKELQFVKEIHIVAVNNEVKELLFLLKKSFEENIHITTINFAKKNIQLFEFDYNSNTDITLGDPKEYLYEPNAAILKSGGFKEITQQFNILKLHQHSHLYTSDELITDFPGRIFKIKDVFHYDKKLKKKLPFNKVNITTRNFPKSVSQLRKELKLKDGGENYMFFTTNQNNQLIVINCVKKLLKH